MTMAHHTVVIEIHRVSDKPAQSIVPTTRHLHPVTDTPTKPEKVEMCRVVARVEGDTQEALDKAINKAIAHLNCERPEGTN